MNRPIAYGFALFLLPWAVAAFAYEQPAVGAGLLVLAAVLALWGSRLGDKR